MTYNNFWREYQPNNQQLVVGNFSGLVNRVHYLFPQGGAPSANGLGVYTTFAALKPQLRSRDVIVLGGVLKEQVVAPAVYDVLVIGASNNGRQATSGGVPTGGGASWLAPDSPTATTPLIRVVAQGWRFENIQFAPVAASACITFDRRETAAIPDSSHGAVVNCYFSTGGASGYGVELIEVKRILIEDCTFEGLTGASGTAIKSTVGGGIADTSHHVIRGNNFIQNVNDIVASMNYGLITGNFFYSTNPVEGGQRIKIDGGGTGRNRVLNNRFSDIIADVTIAKGYKAGTNDTWNNWAWTSTAPIAAVPV